MSNHVSDLSSRRARVSDSADFSLSEALEVALQELQHLSGNDLEIRQLWLELKWLRNNLKADGAISIPTGWDLLIFTMTRNRNAALAKHPKAAFAVTRLAELLRALMRRQIN